MTIKYLGEPTEFISRLAGVGIDGNWEEKPNDCLRLKIKTGAGINYSTRKGTVWFDGPQGAKDELETKVSAALSDAVTPPKEGATTVFVVHGHDHDSRDQLRLALHDLGLEPYVLQNTDGGGMTIIENLEKMIGKSARSSFGIVLLTPDDIGYSDKEGPEAGKPRARQNVILELGMLLSSLTRERVAVLQKGFVEAPSDMQGFIYIPFNDHVKEIVPKLASRLQKAGFDIPAERIAAATT